MRTYIRLSILYSVNLHIYLIHIYHQRRSNAVSELLRANAGMRFDGTLLSLQSENGGQEVFGFLSTDITGYPFYEALINDRRSSGGSKSCQDTANLHEERQVIAPDM